MEEDLSNEDLVSAHIDRRYFFMR